MRSHKWHRMFAEVWPNSHMLPSWTDPNIRPNSSAELRRLPNFGPSLFDSTMVLRTITNIYTKIQKHKFKTTMKSIMMRFSSSPALHFPNSRMPLPHFHCHFELQLVCWSKVLKNNRCAEHVAAKRIQHSYLTGTASCHNYCQLP